MGICLSYKKMAQFYYTKIRRKEVKMKQQYDKKAIYKIENKINHKIYIGQSIKPEDRFKAHCVSHKTGTNTETSLINRAINKYGKENFSFEILGWFIDYNKKEQEYICKFRSLVPNGYNIQIGGEDPPHYSGEQNQFAKISKETAEQIQKDLLNYKIPRKQICKKYNVSQDTLRHINDGSSWKRKEYSYPLRPREFELNKRRADKVKELLMNTRISQRDIGKKVGWNRSAVTMINIGKNHYDPKLNYPLRK